MSEQIPEAYQVRVSWRPQEEGADGASGEVYGHLPEQFELNASSDWDQPFLEATDMLRNVLSAAHIPTRFLVSSVHVWSGSSPLQLSIPIEFWARENAYEEVVQPTKALMSLALPSVTGDGNTQRLVPPGPAGIDISDLLPEGGAFSGFWDYIARYAKNPGTWITVEMGTFLRFEGVILLDAQTEYSGLLTPDGYPKSATCTITFKTAKTLTVDQLDEAFIDAG